MTSTMFRYTHSRGVIDQLYQRLLAETPQARPRRVSTRFGETHLLVAGPERAPPLVVLHGALANSALAIRDGHDLLERFRVHVVDVPGVSVKSAEVRLRMDNADYGEWLQDVLDALELPRAHLFGVSLGGLIARKLAEAAPGRIDRLVLLAPGGIVLGPLFQGITRVGIPLALYRATGSQAAFRRFLDSFVTTPDETLVEYLGQAFKHYKLDLTVPPMGTPESLADFHRPTLIMCGAEDIIVPGRALLQRAAQLFPHATLELLPNCKHIPPTDSASRERLCARVSRFLLDSAAGQG
jgi:2-hydroxy-6-oxonona-2,4-dienedioate hydrolase